MVDKNIIPPHLPLPQILFLAAYFNDTGMLLHIKEQHPQIYKLRHHYPLAQGHTFHLKYLTLFNKIIWFDNDWRNDLKPFVRRMRQRVQRMIKFWIDEGEGDFLSQPFTYNKYHEYFVCDDPNDPELADQLLFEPISEYVKKGFREIDLRLYNRVECFDFEQVEKLLKQGADPTVPIENLPFTDIFSAVEMEESFLATVEIVPQFKNFEQNGYPSTFNIIRMFGDLLGLAAYTEMYRLISRYLKT